MGGLGIDETAREVVILIADHLSWENEAGHFSLLDKKLGAYLDFIKSGQVYESLPQAAGMPLRIKLVHKHPPHPSAERTLRIVGEQLQTLGVSFSHESLSAKY